MTVLIRLLVSAAAITPLAALAAPLPAVSPDIEKAAAAIDRDPAMQALKADLVSQAAQDWRFDNQMELVRIASPSRSEMRRQKEITRRLAKEWGIPQENIVTRLDGYLPGAGIQTVDGLPVYNVCVKIPGTYAKQKGAKSYRGQFPKVLLEGHIDTVNPPVLPPESAPYEPVKLQPLSAPVVKTREELAALPGELKFDAAGRIVKDENYRKAYRRFDNAEAAKAGGALRIYVPGYSDAMINTTAVLQAAVMMVKHGIRPVYDVWVCGTTGEEGKGNLCGMKQLYGYSQETGKGNNALNFVANFGADSTTPKSGTVNYLGSYRFEVKYTEPAGWKAGDAPAPSALMAMNRAIAAIADIRSPWDLDKKAERTTYTVGTAHCSAAPAGGRSAECTLMVDMRSPNPGPLTAMRSKIEPILKSAAHEENAALGVADTDKRAVRTELVWFGDRPAYQRKNYSDIAVQAWLQSARTAGIDVPEQIRDRASSLNDNVPAAVGVPTINFNVGTRAVGAGGHTWYEWGVPGNGVDEGKRVYRLILSGLLAAGYNASDGSVVQPGTGPIGPRTTEELYK
jgi:acetylornithine deacetylase/succinyl-diaminopimelate desuccinylase-like protein